MDFQAMSGKELVVAARQAGVDEAKIDDARDGDNTKAVSQCPTKCFPLTGCHGPWHGHGPPELRA